MKRCVTISLSVGLVVAAVVITTAWLLIRNNSQLEEDEGDSPMLQILDAMQQLMTGEEQFDREYYQELRTCMGTFDPMLLQSHDASWQSIINYWISNGVPGDAWGSHGTVYMEQNETNTNFLNMTIYEPCNYASNVAYYHDIIEFCNRRSQGSEFYLPEEYINALGSSFAGLTAMSSFMHMSHTSLGHQQDNTGIKVISYLLQQGSFAGLSNVSSILTDLSETPRKQTALEISDDFLNMYGTISIDKWYELTETIDVPDYYLTFSAIVSTFLTLSFKPAVVDAIINYATTMFNVDEEIVKFINVEYLPELRTLTANLDLNDIEKNQFMNNSVTTLAKFIYAFLWQEEKLTDNAFFLKPKVNSLGARLLPIVNEALNKFNDFQYFETNFQEAIDVYPGDAWCNPVIPHAKWHLESGVGLLDMVYLADEMYRFLKQINEI